MEKGASVLVWYNYKFETRPTAEKFLRARWHHYKFCRSDINISSSMYLDGMRGEIRKELAKSIAPNKKSLILTSFLDALTRADTLETL